MKGYGIDDMRGAGEWEADEFASEPDMKFTTHEIAPTLEFQDEEIAGLVFVGGYLMYPFDLKKIDGE